jgi:outer membrane protein assembly factor BamA
MGNPTQRCGVALALALLPGRAATVQAADIAPPIRDIVFEGNVATRPETLLREMVVQVNDPADPAAVEHSRQGVQNLGLFRSVQVREEPLDDGVRLVLQVRERYYVLPAPRADYNSDGEYSYGLQLRWKNVWGLNHSLRSTVKYKNRQEAGRGTAIEHSLGYEAPFLFGTPYVLDFNGRYTSEPADLPAAFDDVTTTLRLVLGRRFWRDQPGSESWNVGLGLDWQEQATHGPGAPEAQGHALAPVLQAGYGWRSDRLYSETGQHIGFEVGGASEALGSDYAYTALSVQYGGSWQAGDTAHQTVGVFAGAGRHRGGTLKGEPAFELGGVDSLRGYRKQVERGAEFYHFGAEALRPLGNPSLRGLVFVEAGDVGGGPLAIGGPYADVGLGVRLRLTWFVNLEFSAGVAWPLVDAGDGRGARFYAGGER